MLNLELQGRHLINFKISYKITKLLILILDSNIRLFPIWIIPCVRHGKFLQNNPRIFEGTSANAFGLRCWMRRTQKQADYWVAARWRSIILTARSFCPPRKFASIKTENGHAMLPLKYSTLMSTTIWWEKFWKAVILDFRQKLQRILSVVFTAIL